jgi:hypothetical protein
LLEELRFLREELDGPIQYRKVMRSKILPALSDLDDQLAVKPSVPAEAQKMISELIRSAVR